MPGRVRSGKSGSDSTSSPIEFDAARAALHLARRVSRFRAAPSDVLPDLARRLGAASDGFTNIYMGRRGRAAHRRAVGGLSRHLGVLGHAGSGRAVAARGRIRPPRAGRAASPAPPARPGGDGAALPRGRRAARSGWPPRRAAGVRPARRRCAARGGLATRILVRAVRYGGEAWRRARGARPRTTPRLAARSAPRHAIGLPGRDRRRLAAGRLRRPVRTCAPRRRHSAAALVRPHGRCAGRWRPGQHRNTLRRARDRDGCSRQRRVCAAVTLRLRRARGPRVHGRRGGDHRRLRGCGVRVAGLRLRAAGAQPRRAAAPRDRLRRGQPVHRLRSDPGRQPGAEGRPDRALPADAPLQWSGAGAGRRAAPGWRHRPGLRQPRCVAPAGRAAPRALRAPRRAADRAAGARWPGACVRAGTVS